MAIFCEHKIVLDLDGLTYCELCGSYEVESNSFPSGTNPVWGEVSSFEE